MVDPCWARVSGPLAPYVAGLRGELERLGYTPLSAAAHVRLVAHLSRWMVGEDLAVSALTPVTVDAYFAERRAAGYTNSLTRRSVRPLLDYLRRLGAVASAEPAAPTTPAERLLIRFRDYLVTERGLAASTAELNMRLARLFLAECCRADGQLDLEHLDAGAVSAFVVSWGGVWPRSVGRMVTALRSLLRFLQVDGVLDRPLSVLRHSAATAMLGAGGSLAEIGQVLRHRRPFTTAIYAKVDSERLRCLARPWPGVAA